MSFQHEARYSSECCDVCQRHGLRLLPAGGDIWCCDECYADMTEGDDREDDAKEGFEP